MTIDNSIDSDSDGIVDLWEIDNELDPDNESDALLDPDNDTLTNVEELQNGTDPNCADTDNDGLDDLDEILRGTSPTLADTDRDGFGDSVEIEYNTDPLDEYSVPILLPAPNADIDGDGYQDIIFGGPETKIFWGPDYLSSTQLSGSAHGISLGYIDNDTFIDIVMSTRVDNGNSYIYWGDGQRFQTQAFNEFQTNRSYANVIADIDDDGYQDIIFTNYNEGNAYIYWGNDTRSLTERSFRPASSAMGCAAADLDNDSHLDLVFCGHSGTSCIYWGVSSRDSSSSTKSELSTPNGYNCTIEDLNNDDLPEIIFTNNVADGDSRIYWNDNSRFSTEQYTLLTTHAAECVIAADLDRDDYTDIVFGNKYDGSYETNSYIYWGNENYTFSSPTEIPTNGAQGLSITYLNNDPYLDIIFANGNSSTSYVYFGSANRFDSPEKLDLSVATPFCVNSGVSAFGQNDPSLTDNDSPVELFFDYFMALARSKYSSTSYNGLGRLLCEIHANKTIVSAQLQLPTDEIVDFDISPSNKDAYIDIDDITIVDMETIWTSGKYTIEVTFPKEKTQKKSFNKYLSVYPEWIDVLYPVDLHSTHITPTITWAPNQKIHKLVIYDPFTDSAIIEKLFEFDNAVSYSIPQGLLLDGHNYELHIYSSSTAPFCNSSITKVRFYVDEKADNDNDGLTDKWEQENNLDPLDALDALYDNDGDTLSNEIEFQLQTNPFNSDTDNDGLDDGWEYYHNLNPNSSSDALYDNDGDMLTNVEEKVYNTDPFNPDSDSDTVTDGQEVMQFNSDPHSSQSDNDGIPDGDEVFLYNTNPANWDSDGDKIDDKYEIDNGLDPNNPDDALYDNDGDTLNNFIEYTHKTNPFISDSDNDGIGDGDEVNTFLTNPLLWDTDNDGIDDKWELDEGLNPHNADDALADNDGDNLINIDEYINQTNPYSGDSDGDFLSDGDEVNVHHTNPNKSDSDSDGIPDRFEVIIYHTDPNSNDSDNDGLYDMAEIGLTDPNNADSDGDGLNDGDEQNDFLTNPLDNDSDDDGFSDGDEIFSNTDPSDENDYLKVTKFEIFSPVLQTMVPVIGWNSKPDVVYTIWVKSDAISSDFVVLEDGFSFKEDETFYMDQGGGPNNVPHPINDPNPRIYKVSVKE